MITQGLNGTFTGEKDITRLSVGEDMSGVEVLGLVLGAIPLLISAFEHFKDACLARDVLFQFETNYGHILRQVKDEELFFRMHLKRLLLPVIQDPAFDIDILILDPKDARWKDQGLEELLKQRLIDGYDRYIELLESIATILHKLLTTLKYTQSPFQEKLAATEEAEASDGLTARLRLKLKANLRFRGRHLDYVMSQWNRVALIEELRGGREKLEKILSDNSEIASMQGQGTIVIPRSAIRSLLQQWQHANRVYDLIFSSCPCRQSHCAHLWLQHHESTTFELKLLVFFSSTPSLSQPCPWQQHGLRIQSLDQTPERNCATSLPASVFSESDNVASVSQRPTKRPKNRVRAVGRNRTRNEIGGALRALKEDPAPSQVHRDEKPGGGCKSKKARFLPEKCPTTDSQRIEEIQNLCKALADCGMESTCLGALTAREDSLSYRYKVSSQPEQRIVADEISLFDVLQSSHRPRIQRADRMKIALKIASSHLKLHSTPWVRKQWEAKNIKFPCTRSGARADILTERPFIATDFVEEPFPLPNPSPSSSSTAPFGDDSDPSNKSFVCLGIMLLELQFGYPLEEHELWEQFGKENESHPLFRLVVAGRWALSAEGEAGRDFAQIVNWCLNESPATLKDEKWRKDLADRVVLPLQKCCEWVAR